MASTSASLQVQPGPYYTITRDGQVAEAPGADPSAAFATDGEAAFYVKSPDGTYVQAVTRPVDSHDPSGRGITHYDPSKQLWFNVDAQGKPQYESRALTNNESAPTGGGLLHQNPVWNPATGQYDQGGLDWSNILSLAVGGGLTAGVANAALAGTAPAAADTGAPVLGGTAAGPGATTVAGSGVLPSTTIGTGAVGPITGGTGAADIGEIGSTLPSTAIGNGMSTLPSSTPSGAVPAATGANTLQQAGQVANTLAGAGRAISAATSASQQNQRSDANITQDAYVQDATLEAQQRQQALKNIYAQGFVSSGSHSPFDPTPPIPSSDYLAALNNLKTQGSARLAQPPQYATTNFPSPTSYTNPSTLQQVGTYLGPALTIAGQIPWNQL